MTPTKHLPVGFSLEDWTFGIVDPCDDYFRIAERLRLDPTSPTGLRWVHTNRKHLIGEPAGTIHLCRAGTRSGNNRVRSKDYVRVRVSTPECTDTWAPRTARKSTKYSIANVAAVIWLLTTGNWPPPHLMIDHIDVDGANNSVSNLRLLDTAGNNKNRIRVLRKLATIAEPLHA